LRPAACGTEGNEIQRWGPKNGYVELDNNRYTINAGTHTISGYSAHADQKYLVNFVKRIRKQPKEIRIVHGETRSKRELKQQFLKILPSTRVFIPK